MVINQDVAERREGFYRLRNPQILNSTLNSMKKREIKSERMIKEELDANENSSNNFFVINGYDTAGEQSNSEDNSSYKHSSQNITFRNDRRSQRKITRKKHFDEQYPPEEQTPKRKRSVPRPNPKTNIVVDLPMLTSRREMLRKSKFKKEMDEILSEDEDYINANLRAAKHKGYESTNFLICKFVNKIKYCFDKLKVLSVDNYMKDIFLTEKELEVCKDRSLSTGYSYIDCDNKNNKIR